MALMIGIGVLVIVLVACICRAGKLSEEERQCEAEEQLLAEASQEAKI